MIYNYIYYDLISFYTFFFIVLLCILSLCDHLTDLFPDFLLVMSLAIFHSTYFFAYFGNIALKRSWQKQQVWKENFINCARLRWFLPVFEQEMTCLTRRGNTFYKWIMTLWTFKLHDWSAEEEAVSLNIMKRGQFYMTWKNNNNLPNWKWFLETFLRFSLIDGQGDLHLFLLLLVFFGGWQIILEKATVQN